MSHDAAPVAPATTPTRLDHRTWCRWWRDLIVERYRVAAFDDIVPLLDGAEASWARRVALGALVERSLATTDGPGASRWLVADALDAAGFGPVGHLADSPSARAAARLRSWAPPRLANDELCFGVLGTVADALLAEVPPVGDVDLRDAASRRRGFDPDQAVALEGIVVTATRSAVLAYARQVEDLAVRPGVGHLLGVRVDRRLKGLEARSIS